MERMKVRGLYLVLALTGALFAGEGVVATDGRTARWEGYNDTTSQIDASPPIVLKFNQIAYTMLTTDTYYGDTLSRYDADLQSIYNQSSYSMGLWENLPSCRLNFERGPIAPYSTQAGDADDVIQFVTASIYSRGYAHRSVVATSSGGVVIRGGDIEVNRDFWRNNSYTITRVALAQLLGNLVGFNHSILTRAVLQPLSINPSTASIMSDDLGFMGNRGALNPDDVSVASRLYPDLTAPLWRSTGTIRGLAWGSPSGQVSPLYGAHVFAIRKDIAGLGAVVHRVSGYAESTGLSSTDPRRGFFELDGLAPGTYDVLIAPWNDAAVVGSRSLTSLNLTASDPWILDALSFASGFSRGWVRSVVVASGEVVDLGYVVAGRDRQVGAPTLVDVEVMAPSSPSYLRYRAKIYREGSTSYSYLWPTPSTSRRLTGRVAPARYTVIIQGTNDGYNWYTVASGLRGDWTSRKVSFPWVRKTRIRADGRTAEALAYQVSYTNAAFGGGTRLVERLHGTAYTTYGFAGMHDYQVFARMASNASSTLVKARTYLNVP